MFGLGFNIEDNFFFEKLPSSGCSNDLLTLLPVTSRWKIIQFDGLNVTSAAQQGLQHKLNVSPHSHFHSKSHYWSCFKTGSLLFYFYFEGWRGNSSISSASGIWKYKLGIKTRRGNQQRNVEGTVLLMLRITEGRKARWGRKPYYTKTVKNKQKAGK